MRVLDHQPEAAADELARRLGELEEALAVQAATLAILRDAVANLGRKVAALTD